MLYENAKCRHLDGLDAIMSSCDASILDEIPDEIARLSAHIVKRWWSSHGLPYVTCFLYQVGGENICCLLKCLEIAYANFYFSCFDVGGGCWRGWVTTCW
jgi:hypothetical protein